jgi:TolB-like protein
LEPHDDRKENQNHTYYRDQINKVAMAVKEIMMPGRQSPLQGARSEVIHKPAPTPVRASRKKYAIPVIIIALLALIGYGAMSVLSSKGSKNIEPITAEIDRSIAVLPFANMSADKEQEYFSDGLSEEVLNVLSKVPDMKVISRTSAFSFKGKNEDIRVIGEKLGVAYLLEGSVRKAADKIRITAQLVKASDGSHLWSETFDRGMKDVFKVQDEIASAVVAALKLKLLGNQAAPRESDPEVYNLWMQSRYYAWKGTSEGRKKAFEFAQLAVRKDSTDARAWAQLADCYFHNANLYTDHDDVNKTFEMASKAAEKAISLDQNLPDGYVAKALALEASWEISEAVKYSQKALDLDSSSTTLTLMANHLLCLGDFTKAKILSNKAIARDPLYTSSYTCLAGATMQEGNYRLAIEISKKAAELDSEAGMYGLVTAELLDNNPKAALDLVPRIEDEYWNEYYLILALWGDGQHQASKAELRKFEKEFKEVGPYQIAEIYSWYGEYDKTFEWLEQAFRYRDPGLLYIKSAPFMKPLWKDLRYQAVLKRLNLPVD